MSFISLEELRRHVLCLVFVIQFLSNEEIDGFVKEIEAEKEEEAKRKKQKKEKQSQ